jgi:hypothetical protein
MAQVNNNQSQVGAAEQANIDLATAAAGGNAQESSSTESTSSENQAAGPAPADS